MGKPRIGKMKASLCHRVVAGLFLITLITPGVLGGTCPDTQALGSVCVCTGTCPSFTSTWTGGTSVTTGDGTCIATQKHVGDGDNTLGLTTLTALPLRIRLITYNTPHMECPGTTRAPTIVGYTYAPTNSPTNSPTFAPISNSATARGSNLAAVAVVAVAAMAFEYLA